jgi:hypothetical protein
MNTIAISDAKTSDLVAFYNANIVRFPDGTVIKKFADRKTAEKRVADLVEKIASHFPEDETPEGTIPNPDANALETVKADGAATDDRTNEAAPELDLENEGGAVLELQTDGSVNLSEAPLNEEGYVIDGGDDEADEEEEQNASRKSTSAFNALQATLTALGEKSKSDAENGMKPATKSTGSKASNSDGVAASWVDSEIRSARLTRDGVKVELDGAPMGEFKSTRDAFRALRLPDNKHIRFRLKLKEAHRDHGSSATFEHNGKSYVFSIVPLSE